MGWIKSSRESRRSKKTEPRRKCSLYTLPHSFDQQRMKFKTSVQHSPSSNPWDTINRTPIHHYLALYLASSKAALGSTSCTLVIAHVTRKWYRRPEVQKKKTPGISVNAFSSSAFARNKPGMWMKSNTYLPDLSYQQFIPVTTLLFH